MKNKIDNAAHALAKVLAPSTNTHAKGAPTRQGDKQFEGLMRQSGNNTTACVQYDHSENAQETSKDNDISWIFGNPNDPLNFDSDAFFNVTPADQCETHAQLKGAENGVDLSAMATNISNKESAVLEHIGVATVPMTVIDKNGESIHHVPINLTDHDRVCMDAALRHYYTNADPAEIEKNGPNIAAIAKEYLIYRDEWGIHPGDLTQDLMKGVALQERDLQKYEEFKKTIAQGMGEMLFGDISRIVKGTASPLDYLTASLNLIPFVGKFGGSALKAGLGFSDESLKILNNLGREFKAFNKEMSIAGEAGELNLGGIRASKSAVSNVRRETGGSLIFHENLDGHAIRKHVGKTDQQLIDRFSEQPYLRASSTYSDYATADKAIGDALKSYRGQIDDWISSGMTQDLPLNKTLDYIVGRKIPRDYLTSEQTNKIFVLLRKDSLSPSGYRIHTSYPE